ncbi:MAG TPA: AI-2E family transporter [Candidatus Saccharimonadales bacterium]|nr:AI-2E family transporter [Candidatus Saccharimonadales bacterium]
MKRNQVILALLLVVSGWLLIKLASVFIVLFIAFLFIVMLHPVVHGLKQRRVPTGIAVLIPIVVFIGLIVLIGFFIVPTFISQIKTFADLVPQYLHDLKHYKIFGSSSNVSLDGKTITNFLQSHTNSLSTAIVHVTTTAIKFVVGVVTIIVVTVYGVANYDGMRRTWISFMPSTRRERFTDILARVEQKIVTWLGAQVLLSTVVGIMVGLGSWAIGLPFPALLGLISALLEVVPTLGPVAATVPGFLLGLTISLKVAILAIFLHLIVQQIENHILAPWLLGRTVRLHPIVIIFSLLTGAVLYGLLGTLLAVPVALVVSAVVDSYRNEKLPGRAGKIRREIRGTPAKG